MILCIGTTPAVQRVMVFPQLALDHVNRATTTLEGAAGKSINVAKVLHSLGAHPLATGFLGGTRGAFLQECLAAQGVHQAFVQVQTPTRQCITLIDQSTGQVTELVEESRPIHPSEVEELKSIIQSRMHESQAVVLSGTLAPGVPSEFYCHCARLAAEAGALCAIDAQGPALTQALAARPGLVKPNRAELASTVGRSLPNEPAVFEAMRELAQRGAQRVVVTDGKNPTLAFDGRQFWRITPPMVQAVNPIGSGDAFMAGLVWRLVAGDDLGEAARWGAAAGAANALRLMAGEIDREEGQRLAGAVRVETHLTRVNK